MVEDDAGDESSADAENDGGDSNSVVDGATHDQTVGLGWLAVGVLVVAAVALLLVGVVVDEPVAASATELGIGFAWLLAAAYVGFRVSGAPRLRLTGASAFVVAATAQFVSLVVSHVALEAASLLGIVVGAIALLVLVVRGPDASDDEIADDESADAEPAGDQSVDPEAADAE